MNIIQDLFAQYSIESIIILTLSLIAALKAGSELINWLYSKLKNYFDYKSKEDIQREELLTGISDIKIAVNSINEKVSNLEKDINHLKTSDNQQNKKIELASQKNQELIDKMHIVNERLQENARNVIIDKHHYFCYEVQAIDDFSLQSLERRYMYYKMAGGNSYIDSLMDEIRRLPIASLQNKKIIETIKGKI